MRAYRTGIFGVVAFALVYPAISGGVLILGRSIGVDEIYPFAPWALYCFVPNQEVDYGIRFRSIDGRALEPHPLYEDYLNLNHNRRTIGYAIVQGMGQFARDGNSQMLESQRRQFERTFLVPMVQDAQYDLIQRSYDVLERWETGKCDQIELVDQFGFQADSAGT